VERANACQTRVIGTKDAVEAQLGKWQIPDQIPEKTVCGR
jgi:hypothetical protein